MDPESKQILQHTLTLVEANNKMLRHIRRSQKVAAFTRVVYWLIMIGIGVIAYYFLQPYINQAQEFIKSSGAAIDQFKNILPK